MQIPRLYDKILVQGAAIAPATVQAWFCIYLGAVLTPGIMLWWRSEIRHPFHRLGAIPVIGTSLLAADILYFTASPNRARSSP